MVPKHRSLSPLGGRLAVVAAAWMLAGQPLAAQLGKTLVSCPFLGQGNSDVYHGFYVTGYGGHNLSTVTLGFSTNTAGLFTVSLTAHRNSYDGPLIGTTQTATVNIGTAAETPVIFDFGAAPITPGDTIAFTVEAGQLTSVNNQYGNLFFDAGTGACTGVFETQATNPPLDTVINRGVGITITEATGVAGLGAPCVGSDTVLCLDDYAGDRRFQVTASFDTSRGAAHAGAGQAISLSALGSSHGGLFWFFNPQTPELMVNVINGCSLNDHYWVFVSSPSSAGYTVTVTDTAYLGSKTYQHRDRDPQVAIQDVTALADCNPCTSTAQCPAGLLCCPLPASPKACILPAPGGGCPLYP